MIEAHDRDGGPAFELYALGLEHKHVAETQLYSRADPAADLRAVGRAFPPGHAGLGAAASRRSAADGRAAPICRTRSPRSTRAASMCGSPSRRPDGKLEPQALNDTNRLELRVFANESAPSRGAGRAARQSRQGRVGRGGAEPVADAGAGAGLSHSRAAWRRRAGLRYTPLRRNFTVAAERAPARAADDIEGGT